MQLLIFAERNSPRLQYVFDQLFGRFLPAPFRWCHSEAEFRQSKGPRLNYSSRRLSDEEIFLPAGSLIWESGISPGLNPESIHFQNRPALFPLNMAQADLPFDLPAMFFYLLSRYEEYLPFQADRFGRFPASESLAAKTGFLHRPLLDEWALQLAAMLSRRFPNWQHIPRRYRFLPTFDVDFAWAFCHRSYRQQLRGALGSLLRLRPWEVWERFQVLRQKQADPFYTFPYLLDLHRRLDLQPQFFFLLGNGRPFDGQIPPAQPELQYLIRQINQLYAVGIHPSFQSNEQPGELGQEIGMLESILSKPVTDSRQHFLRLHLPKTYRRLIEAGIRRDFSMGYADAPGFRASAATPFLWYDLLSESATQLEIIPFQVMDVTLKNYQKLPPEDAMGAIRPLLQASRECGGVFCTLWHNSSFSRLGGWTNWAAVYEHLLREAVEQGN